MSESGATPSTGNGGADIVRSIGLLSAPLLAALVYLVLPREVRDESGGVVEAGLTHAGRATAGAAVLMAIWWMTEALPIEVTGLVPLALFPVTGIAKMDAAAARRSVQRNSKFTVTVITIGTGTPFRSVGVKRH